MLLLCAATEPEIQPTLDFLAEQENLKNSVEVLFTGVGLTATTYHLTKAIMQAKPNIVIQAGIAGSLTHNLKTGGVVVVEKESIGDLGVIEKGVLKSMFELGFMKQDEFPYSAGKLCADKEWLQKTGLRKVDGVTVNEVTTNSERIQFYHNNLNAEIESMEGAALHYVCLMEKIPFIQLRSISNYVGERDKTHWNIKDAVTQLNIELQKLILKLLNR